MFEIYHLKYAKQTYLSHLKDALYYSYLSTKASIIFIIHGIVPCILTHKGGTIINNLNEKILQKKSNIDKLYNDELVIISN